MLEALRDLRRRSCVLPPGTQQIEGSLMHQEVVAQTPEGKLRAWIEEHYTHVPLREKGTGTQARGAPHDIRDCGAPGTREANGQDHFRQDALRRLPWRRAAQKWRVHCKRAVPPPIEAPARKPKRPIRKDKTEKKRGMIALSLGVCAI